MAFIETGFPGLVIFEPTVFGDSRGFFYESYNQEVFAKHCVHEPFVQDNQSFSQYGVVRGLHFQAPPHAQSKLVRALSGTILDVVVDIRKGSPTFGQVFSIELSGENKRQLYIPKGFAHGFSVLSDTAEVFYKCDAVYNKESERGILYNDPQLNIDWQVPTEKMIVSEKDLKNKSLAESEIYFNF